MRYKLLILCLLLLPLTSGLSFTPQGDIDLRDIYNITGAPYVNATTYYGDGSQLTGLAGGGDINAVNTNGDYLTGGSTSGTVNLLLNETKLNSTIDLRDSDTLFTNGTGISLIGDIFSIAISYFTDRFIELTDSFGGDVSGTYDNIVVSDDSHTHAYQNITNEPWIEDSQESNLNVNSSNETNHWDELDTPMDITEMGNITLNRVNATCCLYVGTVQATDGNSINFQPSGDIDDYLSLKAIFDRPTWKRHGGKYIYIDSTNVYDMGISMRADDTYSGTLNYEKDNHRLTLIGKNSPIGIKPNSEYKNFIEFGTYNHQPQMSVWNGTILKINDSLEVVGNGNFTGLIYGNGSQLTGITMTESDPYWTANQSSYSTTTEILALNYFNNITNFTGTLTDDKICIYDSSQNIINCTYTDQTGAGGNVKSGDGTYTYNDTDTIYFNSTYAEINLEVNGSDNWDDYNTANSTWFQNIAGALSLKLSELTSWADTWLGTKDTDDLSEGSINLYDNSSWNESLADILYADISVTGDNSSWNETYADTLYRLDSWDNLTGIPHATPSSGDTTHFSLTGEIYDWVIGLGYLTSLSNIFDQDLNTTSGVTFENVSTKAIYGNGDVDTYINWTGTGGDQLELFAGGISFIHMIEGAGNGIAFNQDSNDIDWRVESNDHTHALAVDGGTNKVRMDNYTNCDTFNTDASGILSCGTDADTTYTAGNKLYLDGTEFNVNNTEINTSIEAFNYLKQTAESNLNLTDDFNLTIGGCTEYWNGTCLIEECPTTTFIRC